MLYLVYLYPVDIQLSCTQQATISSHFITRRHQKHFPKTNDINGHYVTVASCEYYEEEVLKEFRYMLKLVAVEAKCL